MKSKIRRLNKSIKRSKKREYKRKKKGGEITNLAEDVKRIINLNATYLNFILSELFSALLHQPLLFFH